MIAALIDLVNNCIYHPILDRIGLTPDSPLFGYIIDNVCQ